MPLYEIIKSLQNAQGNINKQAILDENKDNQLLKEFMRATYDPALSYYLKKMPKVGAGDLASMDRELVEWLVKNIAGRVHTGGAAKEQLSCVMATLDNKGQELLTLLFERSIGASIGDTMVLKTWPDLYFIPPYQRCSLMDSKAKEKFGKLKSFLVQTKCDGSFAYLVKRLDGTQDAITRNGNTYPKEFANILVKDVPEGFVVVGELEVYKDGVLLDRKTGNGLLNSCLKDGELPFGHEVGMTAWDLLTEEEFVKGKSTRKYSERILSLRNICLDDESNIGVVDTWEVSSLAEAYVIYTDHTSRGLEGCVAKDPDSLWKDGTAKDIVKMKIKFEAEYRCIGMYEGEGKASGMMGGIIIATEDGLLECNCGTGFTDVQRKDFWANPYKIDGCVVMLSANEVIQSRDGRKKPSLFLPVFEEIRNDKTVADTLPQVLAQLEAAKNGE